MIYLCKVYKSSDSINHNPYVFQRFNLPLVEKPTTPVASREDVELQNKKYQLEKLTNEIASLQKKADLILSKAEVRAGKIIEKANQDATSVLNASSMEGYKKGLAIASEKTDELMLNTNAKMISILESAKENTDKIINSLEGDMLDLSFDIAEKIIGTVLDRDDKALTAIINKGLAAIKGSTSAKIYMQGEDLKKVKNDFENFEDIKFLEDISLKKGDVIIETEKGIVEAGVEAQLTKIKKAFMRESMSIV